MDSFAFDEIYEPERSPRSGRTKQVKRKWREIEAVKERQRLRKELEEIDILGHFDHLDFDF